MKKIAFIISLGFTFSGIAQTAGTLTFSFNEVSKPASATYQNLGKHVLAVWIQSDLGLFVKTRSRNVGTVTKDHLQTWAVNSGGVATNAIAANCNVVSATTGATLTSFGNRSITWDGTDVDGNSVPDGIYKVSIEETWNHASSNTVVRSFSFVKGPNSDVQTPASDVNFDAITLSWNPTINGIEENSDLGLGVKIFPNPSLEGTFTIQFLKASSISVTDFSGKLLLNLKVEPSTTSTIVNLSSFPNGIYFVNVKEGERVSKNQVILDISK